MACHTERLIEPIVFESGDDSANANEWFIAIAMKVWPAVRAGRTHGRWRIVKRVLLETVLSKVCSAYHICSLHSGNLNSDAMC